MPISVCVCFSDPEAIFALLNKCHAHMTAYLKKTIPDRLHYRNNERVQPIILIADEGWTIVQGGDKLPRCTCLNCFLSVVTHLLCFTQSNLYFIKILKVSIILCLLCPFSFTATCPRYSNMLLFLNIFVFKGEV